VQLSCPRAPQSTDHRVPKAVFGACRCGFRFVITAHDLRTATPWIWKLVLVPWRCVRKPARRRVVRPDSMGHLHAASGNRRRHRQTPTRSTPPRQASLSRSASLPDDSESYLLLRGRAARPSGLQFSAPEELAPRGFLEQPVVIWRTTACWSAGQRRTPLIGWRSSIDRRNL